MTKHHDEKQKEPEKAEGETPDVQAAEDRKTEAPAPTAEEFNAMKDRMLRAMAEAENTRRRLNKELEDTRKFAVSNFAKEMLIVADNFRRALDAVPKDGDDKAEALKHLMTGVEATERQLQSILEKFGITKINPLGQVFDPQFHRVMMEIDDPNSPPGTVLQVVQEGYMIHDRLLREAMVAVAKGGAATERTVDTSA